jgi:hypothetical protein
MLDITEKGIYKVENLQEESPRPPGRWEKGGMMEVK